MKMSNFLKYASIGSVFALAGVTTAQAATISISTETGVAMETEFGVRSDTGTRGVDLAGSLVTATFDDGTSETASWLAFDPFTTGGANGDRWSLYQGGTAITNLISDGRIMTSLLINMSTSQSNTLSSDVVPVPVSNGASVFDISSADEGLGDAGSTPGSSFGFPFEFIGGGPSGAVSVTYSGAVSLVGSPAVGDLFTTMFLDFTGLDAGGFTGNADYQSDQDTLLVAGDLRAVQVSAVPLPAGLPLLLAGLGGLGLLRRTRKG